MKKTLVVLAVIAIVCCFGVSAFATAEIDTPFTDSNLKVNVVETFTNTDNFTSVYLGTPDGSYALDNSNVTAGISFENGVLSALNGNFSWAGFANSAFTAVGATASGFGVHVKNYADDELVFNFYITTDDNASLNGAAYTVGSEKPFGYIADGATEVTVATAAHAEHPYAAGTVVHSNLVVPAGFSGYVMIPYASLFKSWSSDGLADASHITGFGINAATGVEFDNIFFYGSDVTANKAELVLGAPTADLSVIAYAAAAIVGCGALVIGKKRI